MAGSQYLKNGKSHYERNREAYILKSITRKRENTIYIRSIKEKGRCADCGVSDWRVLDFDHLPGSIKLDDVSSARASYWGGAKIDAEIEKCELVCSNCHRIRTYERRQSLRV